MAGIKVEGLTGVVAEVAGTNQLKVITETDAIALPENIGGSRSFHENDQGSITGVTDLASPEVDSDYRMRVSQDTLLDEEVFSYVAQNTGKHNFINTTMTGVWTAGQFTTNGASITTTTTGLVLATYATFNQVGTQTLSLDFEIGFSAQPTANTFVEFGHGIPGAQTVAPTDGVFFRLSSAGLQGIASNNGTETSTGIFPLADGAGTWVYDNNRKYQFIVYLGGIEAEFWVNDGTGAVKLGRIAKPVAQGRMTMSGSGQAFIKHRIAGGAAGGVLQAQVGAYNVRTGGSNINTPASTLGNRLFGSYQGAGGGTMGSLANYANSTNPTAAVPTNTTAALGVGLGGQFWQIFTLAVNADGIIDSYQVPLGTVNAPGRRLVIRGVGLTSFVQTVLVGGPCVTQYSLAFGHTAVSLATAESAFVKAPRRVPLASLTQAVAAAQAVSTMIAQPGGSYVDFGDAPIYVNPGEFVALVAKHIGTVGASGVIGHMVTFVYGWE